MHTRKHTLTHLRNTAILAALILTPLVFYLPLREAYDTAKWITIALLSLAGVFFLTIESLLSKKISLSLSMAFSVIPLGLAAVVSSLPHLTSIASQLASPLGAGAFLFVFLLLLGATHIERSTLGTGIVIGMGILGLLTIYQLIGAGRVMFPGTFLEDPLWTPVGSSMGLITILVVSIPFSIGYTRRATKESHDVSTGIGIVSTLAALIGTVATLWLALPKFPSTIMPLRASWGVMMETFKVPLHALIGVGPDNYLMAFTTGRPFWLNDGPLWNVRFATASTLSLHVATTMGLLGVAALLFFAWKILTLQTQSKEERATLILCVFSLFLGPPNITVLLFVTTIFISLFPQTTTSKTAALVGSKRWAFAAFLMLVVFGCGFLVARFVRSELAFAQAIAANRRGDGTQTYNTQRTAITLNPYEPDFHIAQSVVSLDLAQAIIAQAESTNPDEPIAEEDKQLILSLVQTAVQEAKIATTLASGDVRVWENLGTVYERIMPIAQGADQWAVASHQRAVSLDPTSPLVRLNLGALLMRVGRFEESTEELTIATRLKPDYITAYYNLFHAYKGAGDLEKARAALEAARSLTTPGSDDWTRATRELEELTPNE